MERTSDGLDGLERECNKESKSKELRNHTVESLGIIQT